MELEAKGVVREPRTKTVNERQSTPNCQGLMVDDALAQTTEKTGRTLKVLYQVSQVKKVSGKGKSDTNESLGKRNNEVNVFVRDHK
jgi:hypothetical protein